MKLIFQRGGYSAFLLMIFLVVAPLGAQTEQAETHAPAWYAHQAIDFFQAGNVSQAAQYFAQAEQGADTSLLQTIALYRAEIAVQTDAQNGVSAGATILSDCVRRTKLSAQDALFGKIKASQARFAGLAGDWKNAETFADAALASKDADAKKTATYWKALSLYQTEKYAKAVKAIESNKTALDANTALSVLYAKALVKAGRATDAEKIFSDLAARGALDNDSRLDYARTLLNAGKLSLAREQAEKATGGEAYYLQGIVAFNQRRWENAVRLLQTSRTETPALDETYAAYAQFYTGYAQYRAGQYAEAYTNLTAFEAAHKTHPLRYDALMTASRAAVQSGDYANAAALSERAMYAASTDAEQNEAVLLTAGVYADAGNYDKAISLLSQRMNGKNQFAYQCRYELARMQALQKDYEAADRTYAALSREKLAGHFAEEAAYRRGELQYAQENYVWAANLFEAYTKNWSGGQFYDAALYFTADALAKSGQTDRAILYFMQVDSLRTASTYTYNAEKNLVALYRGQGDYANALVYANKLLKNYGDQARDDGIAKTIDELEMLNKGGNATLLKKEQAYDRAGKDTTANGRAIGTELAGLYAAVSDTRAKGIALAETLLSKQTAPAESQYAAQNALLLAQHYRANGEAKRAAETYLLAAQYARASGNDEQAARSLYGATEAFDAAGLTGDAKATAQSLASLYPSSNFVRAAQQIVTK